MKEFKNGVKDFMGEVEAMDKLVFKPSDFVCDCDDVSDHAANCPAKDNAILANQIYEKWLESQKTVYSDFKENVVWGTGRVAGYKYKAKLVCIEEVEPK